MTDESMSGDYRAKIWVGEADFDVANEYQRTCELATHAGAVVFFVGLVRDLYAEQLDAESVDFIELQHYPGMTESLCEEIIKQAHDRFPFDSVRVLHRVGKIYAGEQIVMVAVASKHRDSAFHASQFIMDFLKTRATFWKKEVGTKGEQWLGVKAKDQAAVKRWSRSDVVHKR